VNERAGRAAAEAIAHEMGAGTAVFIHTDVGDERSVEHLAREAMSQFGRVDIVLNNATVAPLGKLAGYYRHLGELATGYEKDPIKLAESLRHVKAWQAEAEQLQQEISDADR
jgi:NAD(P)-dependent dehydrogenase (short-subunit alcohol dehydrogenase family)